MVRRNTKAASNEHQEDDESLGLVEGLVDLLLIGAGHDDPVPRPEVNIFVHLGSGLGLPEFRIGPGIADRAHFIFLREQGLPGNFLHVFNAGWILDFEDVLALLGRVDNQSSRAVHNVGVSRLPDLDGFNRRSQRKGALLRDAHVKSADDLRFSLRMGS